MSRSTYPPLDTPKPVAQDVWIVDSGPLHVLGMPLPVRMTVVRLRNGDVWLHSPTRLTTSLRDELEAIGPIRHLIAPNSAHWTFVKEWQDACPLARTWAAPKLRGRGQVRRSGLLIDGELGTDVPEPFAEDFMQVVVPGGFGFREVAFFHERSRTLILTDLVLNLEGPRLPAVMRPLARLIGVTSPDGRAPVYLRAAVKRGGLAARQAGEALIALHPERVLFSHGAWFANDATAALRRSLRWLVAQQVQEPRGGD